jgi:hypothetical protein
MRTRPALLAPVIWMALFSAIPFSVAAGNQSSDVAAIEQVIRTTWETAGKKIGIEPVVIRGNHAIASWVQGEHGGRALLMRKNTGWVVTLCSGDGLKQAENLAAAGVPEADAAAIAAELAVLESKLAPEHRALFSTFEGSVSMPDGAQPHSSHDGHH